VEWGWIFRREASFEDNLWKLVLRMEEGGKKRTQKFRVFRPSFTLFLAMFPQMTPNTCFCRLVMRSRTQWRCLEKWELMAVTAHFYK
jgi:hypothetical protein